MVDAPKLEDLDGFIPSGSRVVWWTTPKYGGLPDGAIYRSKGKLALSDFKTDVAIFEANNSFWTIDLWTDEIIRVHGPDGEAPQRELHSRTKHD